MYCQGCRRLVRVGWKFTVEKRGSAYQGALWGEAMAGANAQRKGCVHSMKWAD